MIKEDTKQVTPKADKVFEVSFEVCNKVGGIYRVLESKSSRMVSCYDKDYFLIGPYYKEKARDEFREEAVPLKMKGVFQELEQEGVRCHYGKWLVKGKPQVILVDFKDYFHNINNIKKELWDFFQVDSLNAGYDFDEPVCWSYAVGKLISKLKEKHKKEKVVAHFHEWLSGAGLLYLKKEKTEVGTVFTTHATSIGRTLAFNSVNFYPIISDINPDEEARRYSGVFPKHSLERKLAELCDVFTTVSEITGVEAEHLLKRKPDFILPNGLDMDKFLSFEDIAVKHRIQRRRLRNFVASYFFPYYNFDLEETLFYFIIGRKEFKAKGIDVFIDSLGKLNEKMKKEKSKRTVVAFLYIPTETKRVTPSLLENIEHFRDLEDSLEDFLPETEERLFYSILQEKRITKKSLFGENVLLSIERKIQRLKRKEEVPSISTHYFNSMEDEIMGRIKENNLFNAEEDRVKVIYYPIYLTGHDGLSNLSYEEALEASHMGVFPSFYEPWGYTPLEAAALGVSSVTTDLAGFGRFRLKLETKKDKPGIYILKRENKTDEEIVDDLTGFLYKFTETTRRERVENKIEARKIAALADWRTFVMNYVEAHNKAVEGI
jgi:glycogen synthase